MDMTPREKQVYELRNSSDPHMTYQAIGTKLGMPYQTVRSTYARAKLKVENPSVPRADRKGEAHNRTEYTNPDRAAHVIALGSDPSIENLQAACEDEGLPASATRALITRMKRDYPGVTSEVKRIETDVLIRGFEGLAKRALDSITNDDLLNVNAYQRTLIAAIATDKRELLSGQPTERISIEDRRSLQDLLPMLIQDAERRGLMREINPETGEGFLVERPDAPFQVRAQREFMDVIDVEPSDADC